jgi:hypothetical protein
MNDDRRPTVDIEMRVWDIANLPVLVFQPSRGYARRNMVTEERAAPAPRDRQ